MSLRSKVDHHCKLLCSGHFVKHQVSIEWSSDKRVLPSDVRSQIEAYWDVEIEHSSKRAFIFNGALCRLDHWGCENSVFNLELSPTNYKELLYSNQFTALIEEEFGASYLCKALGVSVILDTQDDHVILIERGQDVGESPGLIDVIGGHVEPPEHVASGSPDPFIGIEDELLEEVGLNSDDYTGMACLGLIETRMTKKPEMVFTTTCDMTAREAIKAGMQKQPGEIAKFLCIDKKELENFLIKNMENFSPSAVGALWLYINSDRN